MPKNSLNIVFECTGNQIKKKNYRFIGKKKMENLNLYATIVNDSNR